MAILTIPFLLCAAFVLSGAIVRVLSKGPLTPANFDNQQLETFSSFGDNVNLQWLRWNGRLPNGAVDIYNSYVRRKDYVCKYSCMSGFYTPSKGPYCYYPYGDKEHKSRNFELLVNKDNFEFLEWKGGSYGSVPKNAVRTCSWVSTYVGQNKYGLGKVEPKHKAFFLPWKGREYWYKSYQVLAINKDHYTQSISNVVYAINKAKIFNQPPETMRTSRVTNNGCQTVVKQVTISKTTTVEKSWNIGRSTKVGIKTSITTKIPVINTELNLELSREKTLQSSKGTTITDEHEHTLSVELKVPPNHYCTVRMEGHKMTADVPYKALLSRTYSNGVTRTTYISGKYDGVQMSEGRAVIDRCQPVPHAKACP
ncbi:natterin-3-like [Hypomesus transpacificus]|uniref:natterin-3-like n=1 Tax=Hypomesus transpacificus TaxID=137520 RepID=UPI001F0870E3|nr:natterin-3-like [Hypomesus transpacificus]